MPNIVFIGSFTPMQRVLYTLKRMSGLKCLALYTIPGDLKIKELAHNLNIKANDIDILKTQQGKDQLKRINPGWIFNVNSQFIFPKEILSIPRAGCLNLHPGKLPEYAGLHAHQWAIRNDEKLFASTINWMEEKVDAGPIAYAQEFPITPKDTGLSLFMKCMDVGAEIALKVLNDISAGRMPPKIEQDLSKRKVYSVKDSASGDISWQWSSTRIYNFIRAVDYYPFHSPTYIPSCILNDGRRINILKAKPSARSSKQAGELVAVIDEGIVIGARDELSLLITKIRSEDDRVIQGKQIAEYLGRAVGEKIVNE